MVIYCKSVHFRGFSSPGSPGQAFYEMASFSENRVLRLLQESGEPRPRALRVLPLSGLARADLAPSNPPPCPHCL